MLKIINRIFLLSAIFLFLGCDSSSQSKSRSNETVNIKVFSSLTCPHCADFHGKIYEKLEKEYINLGKVKFEHVSFPLDLAALNAEKILQCGKKSQTDFKISNVWRTPSPVKLRHIGNNRPKSVLISTIILSESGKGSTDSLFFDAFKVIFLLLFYIKFIYRFM